MCITVYPITLLLIPTNSFRLNPLHFPLILSDVYYTSHAFIIYAVAHLCRTFSYNKFVMIKRLIISLILDSTLFVHVNYVFVNYYFVSTDFKTFVSSKCCQLDSLRRHVTLRNSKKYINFEIFDHSA